jgi:hypothetical protein
MRQQILWSARVPDSPKLVVSTLGIRASLGGINVLPGFACQHTDLFSV